jgi:hypothetical protein
MRRSDELDADRLARLMAAALDGMKALHGPYWPARARPFREQIKAAMVAEKCGVIEAAWVVTRRFKRIGHPVSMVLAAAAELAMEPQT